MSVTLTVYGRPAPKGSMRSLGKGRMVESNINVTPWRAAICAEALAQPVRHLDGALLVRVTLTVPKPKSTRDRAPITRSSGDVDKHLRCVLDALQDADLIADDARVVSASVNKVWPGTSFDALDTPGAVITVQEVGEA
jgi:Holliday junction resolvase RusA-like endonuclease